MCRRAGKLSMGMDPVKDALRENTLRIVLTTADISANSLKEIRFVCERAGVKVFPLDADMNQIWAALGKKSGILGVCDKGFSDKFERIFSSLEDV